MPDFFVSYIYPEISIVFELFKKIFKKWRPSWISEQKMAAVEKVRQIQMKHPKFFESPRCVESSHKVS